MGTVINTNALALNSHKNLLAVGAKQATASKKLSSGNRLISAAVDAAGMAISEKMKSQIEGLDMANKNTQDATSLLQTAEGAMDTINKMLSRVRELVVYASNDTQEHNINGTGDRQKIQDEIDQLVAEIDDTTKKTEFNKKVLLDGSWEDPNETLSRATKNYENVSKAYTDALKNLDAATLAKNGDPAKVSDAKAILEKYNKAVVGENKYDIATNSPDLVKDTKGISGSKLGELTDFVNGTDGTLEEALGELTEITKTTLSDTTAFAMTDFLDGTDIDFAAIETLIGTTIKDATSDDKLDINFNGVKQADVVAAFASLTNSDPMGANLQKLQDAVDVFTEDSIVKDFLVAAIDYQKAQLVKDAKTATSLSDLNAAIAGIVVGGTATGNDESAGLTLADFTSADGKIDLAKVLTKITAIADTGDTGAASNWVDPSGSDSSNGDGAAAKAALTGSGKPLDDLDNTSLTKYEVLDKLNAGLAVTEIANSKVLTLLTAIRDQYVKENFDDGPKLSDATKTMKSAYDKMVTDSEIDVLATPKTIAADIDSEKTDGSGMTLSKVKTLLGSLDESNFGNDEEELAKVNDILSKLNDNASFAENMGTLRTAIGVSSDGTGKDLLTEIANLYELNTYTNDHDTIADLKEALDNANTSYDTSKTNREIAKAALDAADKNLQDAKDDLEAKTKSLADLGKPEITAGTRFDGFTTSMTKEEVDAALLSITVIEDYDLAALTDNDPDNFVEDGENGIHDKNLVIDFLSANSSAVRRDILEKYDGSNKTLIQLKASLASKDNYDKASDAKDKAQLVYDKANNVFESALIQRVNYTDNLKSAQDDYYKSQTINTIDGGQDTFSDREDFISQYGGYINDISKKGGTSGTVQAFDLAIKFLENNGPADIDKFVINDMTYDNVEDMKSARTQAIQTDTSAESRVTEAQRTVDTIGASKKNLEAKIEKASNDLKALNGKFAGLHFQVGANSAQSLTFSLGSFTSETLGVGDGYGHSTINVLEDSGFDTTATIANIDDALSYINTERSKLGAAMNRLDYTSQNLQTASVNLSDAKSRVSDTDMAKEMMGLTQANVLQQAAMSMLAQANQGPQQVLQLLQ